MINLLLFNEIIKQADNLRQQTLQQMHRILTTRQSARALIAINDYSSRLRALSSLWLARPREWMTHQILLFNHKMWLELVVCINYTKTKRKKKTLICKKVVRICNKQEEQQLYVYHLSHLSSLKLLDSFLIIFFFKYGVMVLSSTSTSLYPFVWMIMMMISQRFNL